jgi:hypothetical protein
MGIAAAGAGESTGVGTGSGAGEKATPDDAGAEEWMRPAEEAIATTP